MGRNVIDGFVTQTVGGSTTDSVLYDYDGNDIPSVGGDETWLVSGDSGAPSFVASGSVLGVIGVHWSHTTTDEGDPVGSGDSFAPAYLTDIETLMVGESPTVLTVVPEPGSLLLALLCGASLLPTRRPRRH